MSQAKKTVEELQVEYTKLCSKAGHLQYQISTLSDELKTVNETLRSLNLEAAAAVADKKKQEEAVTQDGATQ